MFNLSRQIRFAIDPFADSVEWGANSYCAKPTAEGLAFYFSLWVELKGDADKDTGFVVNVAEIDKIVRNKVIDIFINFVKTQSNARLEQIGKSLAKTWQTIENDFLPANINSLTLELMPSRKLSIKERTGDMLYFSEKFEFSASHTLWNEKFSDDKNFKAFGKCANKCGHGHNYIVEVTIKTQPSRDRQGAVNPGNFEKIVDNHFIQIVDHKNLNEDVEYFKKINPTVENIAEFGFKSLAGKFESCQLDSVTVWENDRTFCTYRND